MTAAASFAAITMAAACGVCVGLKHACQFWEGICWQVCAQITSGRPCTSLVGGRGGGGECIFWGSNFRIRKCSLKEILLHFGGYSVAGFRKAAAPGTSAEARVPGNCSPVIMRVIRRLLNFETLRYGAY